jgi:uncharacterized membrane protein YbhN (UPF0104 family)
MNRIASPEMPTRCALDARFVRWLVLFMLAGAAIYLGGTVWSGWSQVASAFAKLGPLPLLLAAAVASLSYLVRFSRWHLILRWLHCDVPLGTNFGIYLAGLALTASPGKAGELIRTVLLSPFGVPAKRSLAAFLADRFSDVLGVCLLGAVAGWLGGELSPYFTGALLLLLAGSFLVRASIRRPLLWVPASRFLKRFKRLGGIASDAALEWAGIWSLPRVLLFCVAACVAYGIQALVFAGLCEALELRLSLPKAIEIFVSATLLGAASGIPAGLGAMEATLVVQLTNQGASSALAITAAIATRLVTLWFGIAIGLGSLLAVATRLEALARLQIESGCNVKRRK